MWLDAGGNKLTNQASLAEESQRLVAQLAVTCVLQVLHAPLYVDTMLPGQGDHSEHWDKIDMTYTFAPTTGFSAHLAEND